MALLAALILGTVVAVAPRALAPPRLSLGTAAPAIRLNDADGLRRDVQGTAPGRPVLVEFLDTGCAVCRQEVAAVCRLAVVHPNARVVAVDAVGEDGVRLRQFRRDQGAGCIRFPLLVDPGAMVTHAYGVSAVPTIYLLDSAGRVAYSGVGAAGVEGAAAALARIGV
ncbi:MAG: TlpA family protein disulfide reductase [Candidatus Dormibacteria bacterium]